MTFPGGVTTATLGPMPTPQAMTLLGQLDRQILLGDEGVFAASLTSLADESDTLGNTALAQRLRQAADATLSLELNSAQWRSSHLRDDLNLIFGALESGRDFDEVVIERVEVDKEKAKGAGIRLKRAHRQRLMEVTPARPALDSFETVDWSAFSTETIELEPDARAVATAGKSLGWFLRIVAGHHGADNATQIASLFDMPRRRINKLTDGTVIPRKPMDFPIQTAVAWRTHAAKIEPQWGDLMGHLTERAALEAYGIELVSLSERPPWQESFTYDLQRYYVNAVAYSEEAKNRVRTDTYLGDIIHQRTRRRSLDANKGEAHTGRREYYETWLKGMADVYAEKDGVSKEEFIAQRRLALGHGVMREHREVHNWFPPLQTQNLQYHLQWLMRKWVCYHWYGAVPVSPGSRSWSNRDVTAFVTASNVSLPKKKAEVMIQMMGRSGYLSEAQQQEWKERIDVYYQ